MSIQFFLFSQSRMWVAQKRLCQKFRSNFFNFAFSSAWRCCVCLCVSVCSRQVNRLLVRTGNNSSSRPAPYSRNYCVEEYTAEEENSELLGIYKASKKESIPKKIGRQCTVESNKIRAQPRWQSKPVGHESNLCTLSIKCKWQRGFSKTVKKKGGGGEEYAKEQRSLRATKFLRYSSVLSRVS